MTCESRLHDSTDGIATLTLDRPDRYFLPRVIGMAKAAEMIFTGGLRGEARAAFPRPLTRPDERSPWSRRAPCPSR
jgi:hypothetical protein